LIASAPIWITTAIFILTYAGLAIGRIPGLRCDRAGIAFIGAAAMLCTGMISLEAATRSDSIDYETLFLLLGMMIVVGFLRISGFFAQITYFSIRRIKSPRALLLAVILLSGILSAFLVNDIVCLALTPLVLHLTQRLRFEPMPHLIGLATAANIGSVGTITGNPQNMIIGVQSHISYMHFAMHLMPVAVIGLLIDFVVIAIVYRQRLKFSEAAAPTEVDDKILQSKPHRRLRFKSEIIALITISLFFTGLPIALIAIGAAAILMLNRIKPDRIERQIDWRLLLMFIGLFIVVHAFQIRVVNTWGIDRWHLLLSHPVDLLSLASAALSNLVSNVPAVLLFEPVMRAISPAARPTAWLALAMSSTFAGNFTVLGSVANLIVVENARRARINISFWEYCKAGIPVTVLTLVLGIAWLSWVR
jgi:Na+/H+ antiporter NhaD/arsenite permease-like protein